MDIGHTDPYGIQIALMNYQLYNDRMKKYIAKFKNGSFILKPESLRYIPSKDEHIVKSNVDMSSPKSIYIKDWVSLKI